MLRYAKTLIALHWLMAALVLLAYVTSGNPVKAKTAFDVLLGQVHVASGLLVFGLLLLRLPLRLLLAVPKAEPGALWQQRAATFVHFALYALMLIVPLAGWAALGDKTTTFSLAGYALPLPDGHSLWVKWLGEAHQTLGNVFIWLAGLYALAALGHHYWLRDRTLFKMLPLKIFQL
jgi:cytochrome b561